MVNALIIDDNPGNVEALLALLRIEQVAVASAHSPREIDTALKGIGPVQLVFLDLEFPNDNGLEAVHALRADPRLKGARFIAYTVHTSERNEALSAGFDGFIGKPLSVDRFPEQLARLLSGEAVWEI